ncbi:MAG: hypothetical protein SFU56_06320 [Capsulimonadales bacterium]|nr:hypothetical protein [Capsulimonadales bacterium]
MYRQIGRRATAVMVAVGAVGTGVNAGGFGILAEPPRPEHDARLRDCVLVYRAGGCYALNGTLKATFEGIVDGKRVSLPVERVADLTVVPQETPGMEYYGLGRPKLPEGRWALSLTAVSSWRTPVFRNGKPTKETTPVTSAKLIPFRADGTPMPTVIHGAKYRDQVVQHYIFGARDRERVLCDLLSASQETDPATDVAAR